MVRRSALRTASNHDLRYLSLHKAPYRHNVMSLQSELLRGFANSLHVQVDTGSDLPLYCHAMHLCANAQYCVYVHFKLKN